MIIPGYDKGDLGLKNHSSNPRSNEHTEPEIGLNHKKKPDHIRELEEMKRQAENSTRKTINIRKLQRRAKLTFFKEIIAGGKKVKEEMLEKGRCPKCTLPKCGILENNNFEEPLISDLIENNININDTLKKKLKDAWSKNRDSSSFLNIQKRNFRKKGTKTSFK